MRKLTLGLIVGGPVIFFVALRLGNLPGVVIGAILYLIGIVLLGFVIKQTGKLTIGLIGGGAVIFFVAFRLGNLPGVVFGAILFLTGIFLAKLWYPGG